MCALIWHTYGSVMGIITIQQVADHGFTRPIPGNRDALRHCRHMPSPVTPVECRPWIHLVWKGGLRPKSSRCIDALTTTKSGWWFEPLWKILVNWDDYSQYMGNIKCSKPPTRNDGTKHEEWPPEAASLGLLPEHLMTTSSMFLLYQN